MPRAHKLMAAIGVIIGGWIVAIRPIWKSMRAADDVSNTVFWTIWGVGLAILCGAWLLALAASRRSQDSSMEGRDSAPMAKKQYPAWHYFVGALLALAFGVMALLAKQFVVGPIFLTTGIALFIVGAVKAGNGATAPSVDTSGSSHHDYSAWDVDNGPPVTSVRRPPTAEQRSPVTPVVRESPPTTTIQKPARPTTAQPGPSAHQKLGMLEQRLLEGQISESTYLELKQKYEREG